MKGTLISLYLLIILYNIQAQKWQEIIGFPNTEEYFQDVTECYDKGYLISGANDVSPYPNLLIKTDINGSVLWEKNIQHNNYNVAKGAIDQNNSGEIAIVRCISFPTGDQWPSVIKLDSCGNKLWCRVYIDDDYNSGCMQDVIIYDNGDVLALGYLQSLENYNERIFLYYIDSNGTLVWRQSYASKDNHPLVLERTGYGLHRFNNEYIISGRCYYPHPWNPNVGYQRPFFIGVDTLFEEKWILPFGLNDTIFGKAHNLIQLSETIYMGVGARFLTGYEQNSLLMFFNISGEELGYSQIPNEVIGSDIQDNIISDIDFINDSLFIASVTFGPNEMGNPFGEFIIDTAANIYKIESRLNTEGISTLIKTFDDKFVIGCTYEHPNGNEDIYLYKINDSLQMDTVYPGNYTYDSLCPYQIQSGIIDITDCLLVTDVGETPSPKEYFASLNTIPIKAYPNPANGGEITFELQNTQLHHNMELRCFNVFGKLVHEEKVYQYQGESKVNIANWKPGMYVALVYSNGQVVGQAKFVVQ